MAAQGYIGRAPGESSVVVARQTFTPTGITTNFTFASGYTVGYVDAYLNGARLIEGDDYTATDGSVVGLTTHAINGDVLEIVVYKAFNLANVTGANGDFSVPDKIIHTDDVDTAIRFPQVDTFTVETAGSEVLRVDANGNVGIGTTNTLAVADPKNQSVLNVGVVTSNSVTAAAGTFGSLNVSGTLTYDDVTNVDAVGYSTFREGINVQGAGSTTTTLNVTGVTTMTGDVNIAAAFNIPDAITHVGDTNTKIRFPAADTFTVETGGSERVRVDSSGNFGIGTASPATPLDVLAQSSDGIAARLRGRASDNFAGLQFTPNDGTSQSGAIGCASNTMVFSTGPTERARIDSSGRLLIGTSTVRNAGNASQPSRSPLYFIEGAGANAYSLFTGILGRADANGPNFVFAKTRSNAIGDNTSVQNGDVLGQFFFAGADGTDLNSIGASIQAEVDGTPGTNDMPGRLIFSTTADGASTPTERLRITSDGKVGVGDDVPDVQLNVKGSGTSFAGQNTHVKIEDTTSLAANVGGLLAFEGVYTSGGDPAAFAMIHAGKDNADTGNYAGYLRFFTRANGSLPTERLRIDSSGNFGIGTDSPLGKLHIESAATAAGWQLRTDSVGLNNESGFYRDGSDNYELVLRNGAGGLSYLKNDGGASTANLSFNVQGSEHMRIDSSGRLLIGQLTTSAVSTLLLENNSLGTGRQGVLLLARGEATPDNGDALGTFVFTAGNHDPAVEINARRDGGTWTAGSSQPTRIEFSTTADGASSLTERLRITSAGLVRVPDNGKFTCGAGDDLKIYHDGSQSYIAADDLRITNAAVNETLAKFLADGAVELNHNDSKKFETTSSGVSVTGDMTASGNVTAYSDITLKENIETIPNALDKVLNLRGVEFDRIDKEDNPHEIGVIAQEVEEIVPEVVITHKDGLKSVAYGNLVGLLIESIKELKAEVNDLKAQVEG
jgi:hypothetical protein